MKSILLTTTAIVAFAGAAAADGHTGISFAGEAELGYNDDVTDGFYWDASVDATMAAELNNGVTASATFGLNVVEDDLGETVSSSDYVLSLTSDNASLTFGDVDPVAEANYGGVDGDSTAGFNDQDVHLNSTGDGGVNFDAILAGSATFGGVTAMISYGVGLDGGVNILPAADSDEIDALQVYASGDFGSVSAEVAYQGEFAGADAVIGVSASTTVAGAELTAAYLGDGTETSMGVAVSYPVGPVVVGGYYSLNDVAEDAFGVSADYAADAISVSASYEFAGGLTSADADDSSEIAVEGSYDVGNGITALGGFISTTVGTADATTAYYVAGTYDLGGGAELLVSFADDEANATNDEIGDPEYNHGTTVAVSFSF